MSELTSTTPSTSSEGGAVIQGVPLLQDAVVEVTDFVGDYGGDWGRVKEEVKGINRTDKERWVATARVHFVAIDRSVRKIGYGAFSWCRNLVKVTAPLG